ncbi:hypothetical protein [Pseudoxanthomonas winnipegensis]|nr:hypothetical protein [Pseudoxanthomonas winnipegensis]
MAERFSGWPYGSGSCLSALLYNVIESDSNRKEQSPWIPAFAGMTI